MTTFKKYRLLHSFLLWGILQVLAVTVAAQFKNIAKPLPRFKNINTSLFQNADIKAICQTGNGIVFTGTSKGLFIIKSGSIAEIDLPPNSSNNINSLLEFEGNLFIGTNNGIVRLTINSLSGEVLPVLKLGDSVIKKYCMVADINASHELLFYTGYDTSAYYLYNLISGKCKQLFNRSDGFRALQKDHQKNITKLWAVETTGLIEHELDHYRLKKIERLFTHGSKQPVLSIYNAVWDEEKTLWCITNKGLMWYTPMNQKYGWVSTAITGTQLTDIQLSDTLIYCSSAQEGISVIHKNSLKRIATYQHIADDAYSLLNNHIQKILLTKNRVLIAVSNSGISLLPLYENADQVFNYQHLKINEAYPVLAQKTTNGIVVANQQNVYWITDSLALIKSIQLPNQQEPIVSILPQYHHLWICTRENIYDYYQGKLFRYQPLLVNKKIPHLSFITPLTQTGLLVAGGADGLYIIDTAKRSFQPFAATANEPYQNYQFVTAFNQYLLAGTYFSYLDILSPNINQAVSPVRRVETFANIFDAIKQNESTVLLATSEGLMQVNTQSGAKKTVSLGNDKAVYHFCIYNKDSFVIAASGLLKIKNGALMASRHPLNNLIKQFADKPMLLVNDMLLFWGANQLIKIPMQAEELLKENQHSINLLCNRTIEADGIYLPDDQTKLHIELLLSEQHPFIETLLRYKLLPVDRKMQYPEGYHLNFDHLAPGNYSLLIQALSNNQVWYERTIEIKVAAPWYQKIWVLVCGLILLLLLLLWLFQQRMRKLKNRLQEKLNIQQKFTELENKALRAQMNPHFIFNTLNSINSCIVQNETEKASEYLLQFSRLIRLTLDNSLHESISLEKEIESAKSYLEVEKNRLNQQFCFDFLIDKHVNTQAISVPPLILQPYLENAIWHGLVHLQPYGKIQIKITATTNDICKIEIEDNGIGRKQAAALQQKQQYQSLGTSITQQRLHSANTKNEVKVIDVENEKGQAVGTIIQLTIHPLI
jgi:ligand-binding sensor domain-containing protein